MKQLLTILSILFSITVVAQDHGMDAIFGSVSYGTVLTMNYAVDTSSTDSYGMVLSVAPRSYEEGEKFSFKASNANTAAATLNVNGLGAKTIKKLHDQDLATGDIEAGQIVTVIYDGTNFQMTSQLAQ